MHVAEIKAGRQSLELLAQKQHLVQRPELGCLAHSLDSEGDRVPLRLEDGQDLLEGFLYDLERFFGLGMPIIARMKDEASGSEDHRRPSCAQYVFLAGEPFSFLERIQVDEIGSMGAECYPELF